MAQVLSPRHALTTEEKVARDLKYKVEVKQFAQILKELAQAFNGLIALNTALTQAGKGAYLVFVDPTTKVQYKFDKRLFQAAKKSFVLALKDLKNYLRVSKRKSREKVLPSSFKAVYAPVYAADALREFFVTGSERFGSYQPDQYRTSPYPEGFKLMDQLGLVQQGYLLRNTITLLFFIYAHQNGLQQQNAQFAKSDDVMNYAFGGQIPAAFYAYIDPITGKSQKVPMGVAVKQGLVQRPLNTYEVVTVVSQQRFEEDQALLARGIEPKKKRNVRVFDPNNFNTYFIQSIAGLNYYSKSSAALFPELSQQLTQLDVPEVRDRMLREHDLVQQVRDVWRQILAPDRKRAQQLKKEEKDRLKREEKLRTQQLGLVGA